MCAEEAGRSKEPKSWAPLSDVWLSIATAVVTALLVNTISGFRIEALPVLQLVLLIVVSVLIGVYAMNKVRALYEIEGEIDEENMFGIEKALARKGVREKIYGNLRPSALCFMYGSIVCVVLVVSLIFAQAWLDKQSVDDQALFYKQSTTDQAEFRQSLAKDVEQISAKVNELKTQYAELIAMQRSARTTQQAGEVNSGGAVPQNNIEPVDSNSTEEKQPDK
ncbi:MAG: hypothetical protein KAI35_05660 [Desulfobulbaceae bacterium]|nr:hypothetical protein [Desulfobulbaceae bacterium]